ncbi:MAG: DnaB-like helicase N-terminal domain-containing protein [Gallionella sp.]
MVWRSKCADLTGVADALEIADELNQVGGLSYLHSLTENLPADEDIRNYALILRERSVSRNSPNRRIDEELLLLAELLRKRFRERIRRNMLPIICAEISARVMRDTGITSEQLIDDAIAELIKLKNSA